MTKKKLILLTCAALSLVSACDLFTSREQRLARAEQSLAEGDYGAAIVEIRNLVEKDPGDARALLALARVQLQTGDLVAASSALERAAETGADPAQIPSLQARLMLLRGQAQQLLQDLDNGKLALNESESSLLRAQALQSLGRGVEALAGFKSVLAANPANVPARIGLAESLFAAGDTAGALRELEQAVAGNGDSAELLVALGILRQRLGQQRGAEEAWRNAMPHAKGQLTVPQHLGLINSLANVRLAANDIPGTESLLAEMVKVAPQGPMTRLLEGRLNIARNKSEDAARSLQGLVNEAPDLHQARIALISALMAHGSVEQAARNLEPLPEADSLRQLKEAVQAAAKAAPDSAARWTAIGAAQLLVEQAAAARRAFERAVAIDPGWLPAASALVSLDLRAGQLESAARSAEQLVARFPQEPMVGMLLGEARMMLKDYIRAEAAYSAVWGLRRDPTIAVALYRARQEGGIGKAMEPLSQLLAERPQETGVRMVYAEALNTSGQKPAAMREYERLVRDAPRNVVAFNNLAMLYLESNDRRALKMAERAYQLAPGAAAVADTYGWILVQQGQAGDALKPLREAHDMAPANQEITYHYAAALERAGDKTLARELLERLLADTTGFASREAAKALLESL